jgi:hypothetical protein
MPGLFFPWRWGGSDPSVDTCLYASILRIPQMIWVWRATVEWYWQGKTEELGEKPVPVPLCPPQIPHGLNRASAVRGRRLTTWAMARPMPRLTDSFKDFRLFPVVIETAFSPRSLKMKARLVKLPLFLCFRLITFQHINGFLRNSMQRSCHWRWPLCRTS